MPSEGDIVRARDVGRTDNRGSEELVWRVCQVCGNGKWIRLRGKRKRSCQNCTLKGRLRNHHPTWKGGRNTVGGGYIQVYIEKDEPFYAMRKGKYILEHRLFMAQHLGRRLHRKELVHHLNGIRDDNRLENLAIVDSRTHPHITLVKLQRERIKELEQEVISLKEA